MPATTPIVIGTHLATLVESAVMAIATHTPAAAERRTTGAGGPRRTVPSTPSMPRNCTWRLARGARREPLERLDEARPQPHLLPL